MKKSLLTTAALALGLSISSVSNAQLSSGSIAPDFTLTDLQGNSHHLYAYLNAGKTVFIDCSAAWCSPCWNYHQSGALDNLYTQYGPPGTDELMVLFIEGEHTNTGAQITGTSTGSTYANFSQGDWTAGTPFPIIDDPSTSTFLSDYAIGYFPTIYMICPDKVVREVGQLTTAQLYAAKQSTCVVATAANDASLMNSLPEMLMACDSVIPTFKLTNESNTTLTSATITFDVDGVYQKTYNWTGSLATYAMANVTGIKLGAAPGSHTITATVSNPNGGADAVSMNDMASTSEFTIFNPIGGAPVVEGFQATAPPSNWIIQNGGSADTWSSAAYGGFGTSTQSVTLDFYNIPSGEVDAMILPPQSFAGATGATLTFDVANARYNTTYSDKLRVKVSTNCGATWASVYYKSGSTLATAPATTNEFFPTATQWRTETVNLNTYAGQQNVLVMFEGTSDYGNDLYVDNVNIAMAVTGIKETNNISLANLYPNPTSAQTTLELSLANSESVVINIYNSLGELVHSEAKNNMPAGDSRINLATEGLANGMYNVTITSKQGFVTKKLTVSK